MQISNVSDPARKLYGAINVLQAERHFPLALVPHLILFFAGEKLALRLVLRNLIADSFRRYVEQLGYFSAEAPIAITQVGDQWGQVDRLPTDSATGATHQILVISSDQATADRTLDLELFGESSDVGQLLGYPECCVAAYPKLAHEAQRWPETLMARSPEPLTVSMWCNRLASLWGGTCPTGELFPCSLECPNAIQYGQLADRVLREHGFTPLADEILRQACRPIFLLDGEVVAGSPSNNEAREFTIRV